MGSTRGGNSKGSKPAANGTQDTNGGLPEKLLPPSADHERGDQGGSGDSQTPRRTWSSKGDFFMTAVSSAIGLGNIWRFPYKCYSNGGGAFLIAFVVMVALVGFPLVCLDLALGQLGGCGPLEIWKICPAFEGVGWAILGLDLVANVYYILLIALGLLYMIYSLRAHLPWATCDHSWNTPACRDLHWVHAVKMCREESGVWFNNSCVAAVNLTGVVSGSTTSSGFNLTTAWEEHLLKPQPPSEEFFHNQVLHLSSGIDQVGSVQLPLLGCLLLSWLLVFLGLCLGVRSWGKISYVTTLFPYVILTALLVQTLREDGAADGILFFISPDWSKLASPKVWADAAVQAFFSLNCGSGALITIGSHNKKRNNCFIDGVILTVCDFLTSMLCGIVVFAILGHLANALQVPVPEVVGQGAGLAFIVYPEMLARMPIAPLWSALFMFMIFNLGLGSCMPITANVQTIFVERFPALSRGKRPLLLLAGLIMVWATVGISLTTQAGMYILQMLDTSVPYILIFTGLCKVISVGWVYGLRRLIGDLGGIVGKSAGWVWTITCSVTAPIFIVIVMVCNITDYRRLTYGAYTFPIWADAVAWIITVIIGSAVPATAIYRLVTMKPKVSFRKRLRILMSPTTKWQECIMDDQPSPCMKELLTPKHMENDNQCRFKNTHQHADVL